MGILEVVKRHKIAEILEQGIEQGIGNVIKNALDNGRSVESIAEFTNMPIDEIKTIMNKNGWTEK